MGRIEKPDEIPLREATSGDLSALRRHQRRLLYGGGGLLTLLIVLTALGSCYLGIDGYQARQKQVFLDGQGAIDTFLVQRDRGYTRSLYSNDLLWSQRQPHLVQTGTPVEKEFLAGGEQLAVQASELSVPWLTLGRNTAAMPAGRLAAYLGLIYESSSHSTATVTEIESPGSLSVYAYDNTGSLFSMTGVHDEAQLFRALKVSTREQAFAKLTIGEDRLKAAVSAPVSFASRSTGRIVSYFDFNPFNGDPSLVGVMSQVVDGKPYYRMVIFEPAASLRQRLFQATTAAFIVVTHAGQIVFESGPVSGTPASQVSMLRAAGLWSPWPAGQALDRIHGTFLVADRLKGVDWAIVHIYTWHDMLAELWQRLALTATATALILAMLWLLLLRMDQRVFAPALASASRVYESEALNRTIIETSPVGLCLLDAQTARPILQNDVIRDYADRIGDEPQLLYARLVAEYSVSQAQADGHLHDALEFTMTVERPGARRWNLLVAATATTYRERRALLCALRDVTAQTELEENLRQARQDSESAKLAAESASHAKSSFVATMSHEIRTPLNGILGHLELLSRSRLDVAQRERLHRINLSADSLLSIISDVLDFSKIEAGQLDVDPVPFALRPLVEQAALLFAPTAQAKGLKLYFGIDPTLATGYIADASRIRQVLNNLVSNAVKFTDSGRVALRVSHASDEPGGQALRFDVIDSGIGLTPAQLAHLFEPFAQADSSISRRFGGSGLGLALCSQIARLLGGTVSVDSTPGVGSIFTALIPVRSDADAPVNDGTALAGVRVGLLSGAAEWRMEISALLSSWGAEVSVAGQPSGFDKGWLREAAALVVFGIQPGWSEEEERELASCARRVIRARADGPLYPETIDGAVHISCYSSAALLTAIRQGAVTGHPLSFEGFRAADEVGARGHVMLADDNPVNRELIQQQLEELGFSVDAVEDGEAALHAWNDTYVALLTDINMPRMSGYELTLALRARGVREPILAVTATALASEKQRCRNAGITDLLLKPLSLEQLDAAMTRYVAPATIPVDVPAARPLSDKVRRIFVVAGRQDMDTMLEAVRARDEGAVLERLHSLKGALFVVGEHAAARQCASIEILVEEEGLNAVAAPLAELEQTMRSILDRHAGHVAN